MSARAFLADTFEQAEAAADRFRASNPGRRFDRRVASISVLVSICLCGIYYIGNFDVLVATLSSFGARQFADTLKAMVSGLADQHFALRSWWALTAIFFYLGLPALFIRLVWGESWTKYGLESADTFKDTRVCLYICAVVLPVVALVSLTPGFQSTYPLYVPSQGEALLPDFVEWEFLYLTQLFALE